MKNASDTSAGSADGRTRDRVVRLLLENGPSTAGSLGEALGLSPAAIRRHLDALVADGTIMTRTTRTPVRRGRGRPAKHYVLTDAGHEAGPTAYSDLATDALRHLAEVGGPAAVAAFATSRAHELEDQLRDAVATAEPADKTTALAAAMSAAGYTASVSQLPSGMQICQHHCPVQHVAMHFPALCDAETAALARVLDTHVQRLATIAHGDGVCTTYVPGLDGGHPPVEPATEGATTLVGGAPGAPEEPAAHGPPAPDGPPAAPATIPSTSAEGSSL